MASALVSALLGSALALLLAVLAVHLAVAARRRQQRRTWLAHRPGKTQTVSFFHPYWSVSVFVRTQHPEMLTRFEAAATQEAAANGSYGPRSHACSANMLLPTRCLSSTPETSARGKPRKTKSSQRQRCVPRRLTLAQPVWYGELLAISFSDRLHSAAPVIYLPGSLWDQDRRLDDRVCSAPTPLARRRRDLAAPHPPRPEPRQRPPRVRGPLQRRRTRPRLLDRYVQPVPPLKASRKRSRL